MSTPSELSLQTSVQGVERTLNMLVEKEQRRYQQMRKQIDDLRMFCMLILGLLVLMFLFLIYKS